MPNDAGFGISLPRQVYFEMATFSVLGVSGQITIDMPQQHLYLQSSAVLLRPETIEARYA
jgi:hypothetical protein